MKKVCDIILALLIVAAIIFFIIIGYEYIRRQKNEEKLSYVVEQIQNINIGENKENRKEIIKLEGYEVVGIIEIPKIDIKYPIVGETSDEAMKIAITKFWGNNINEIGNYTMAGHNYKNGTMFGEAKYLEIGDIIKMTDLDLNTLEYEVFKIYTIDPNDVTCIESVDPNAREITLLTCTNGHKNRLVIKAREIKK